MRVVEILSTPNALLEQLYLKGGKKREKLGHTRTPDSYFQNLYPTPCFTRSKSPVRGESYPSGHVPDPTAAMDSMLSGHSVDRQVAFPHQTDD